MSAPGFHTLTPLQLQVLRALASHDHALAVTLAKALGGNANAVGHSLSYLAKAGLAGYCEGAVPTKTWFITPAGRAALADPACHPARLRSRAGDGATDQPTRTYEPRFDGGFSSSGSPARRGITMPAFPWAAKEAGR